MTHWQRVFAELDVCVEPVLNLDEVVEHPQYQAREMFVSVENSEGNKIRQIGHPIQFSEGEIEYRTTGAKLGEHSQAVLLESGYSELDIRNLFEEGAVG